MGWIMSFVGIDIEATAQAARALRESSQVLGDAVGTVTTAWLATPLAGSLTASLLGPFQVAARLCLRDAQREVATLGDELSTLTANVRLSVGHHARVMT